MSTTPVTTEFSDHYIKEMEEHGRRLQFATGQRRAYTHAEIVKNLVDTGLEEAKREARRQSNH